VKGQGKVRLGNTKKIKHFVYYSAIPLYLQLFPFLTKKNKQSLPGLSSTNRDDSVLNQWVLPLPLPSSSTFGRGRGEEGRGRSSPLLN